ncbi:hypothetical protein [Corynebacterium caspium]|uniref:hypothetical protein n=1 Tax=Corynebacterium caspium TaxID=234828 RepID=UPI00037210A6|nr:hypothetical protein [Corynebacterium caspium]WKD59192.1 hypothetical protein CCASP_03975 [Corynebacterium caspium DSM 44850]
MEKPHLAAQTATILRARNLPLGTKNPTDLPGANAIDIASQGLSLIHTDREAHSTTLALILAGRMKAPKAANLENAVPSIELFHKDPASGEIQTITAARKRARYIALAGVPEIDDIDRLVPVHNVVREVLAWANPWYKRTPKDLSQTSYAPIASALELDVDPNIQVGELSPLDRFRLRCVLSLLVRPHAELLIVDDVDQLRSMKKRALMLHSLAKFSAQFQLPIAVFTVNQDPENIAQHHVELGTQQGLNPAGAAN